MILLEDLHELHKLDMNILAKFFGEAAYRSANMKDKMKEMFRSFDVGNNSKIYVEPLKNEAGAAEKKHTWKYATEHLLTRDDVAGLFLRSNRRQLFGVLKKGGDYYYAFSDVVEDLQGSGDFYERSVYRTGSLLSIRNKMSKTVKAFLETYPNAKKNWDVIVILKDTTIQQRRNDRFQARQNMEYKPQDKQNYENYIKILKDNLSVRLTKYVNSKVPNNITQEELSNLLTNAPNIFVKKIKLAGFIYELTDTSSDISRSREKFEVICTYTPTVDPYGNPYNYNRYSDALRRLEIIYQIVGKEVTTKSISFRDGFGFEDGISRLLDKADELKKQSQS